MNQEAVLNVLMRKLDRANAKLSAAKKRVDDAGGPTKFTYHGGWDVGYWSGRVSALEEAIDEVEVEKP